MKNYVILLFLIFATLQSALAQKTVSGTVTDASDGSAIPGVSVAVKGTTQGTITDMNGKYSLEVKDDAQTLVFSFVGMQNVEESIGTRSVINVALETESIGLDEVVVTALGVQRSKKSFGYAISEVESDETVQKAEPDMLRSLQGKVAGVDIRAANSTPGSATRITIRGNSSFRRENQPLIVVDGIPYSNEQYETSNQLTTGAAYGSGLSTLDPNSIESIQVLRGAAAAALYGSRAANGVLLIKTKGGAAKIAKKGMEVTYRGSYAFENVVLPEYQNTYGAGHNFTFANDNGSWGPRFDQIDSIPMWPSYAAAFDDLPDMIAYEAQPDNVKNLFETGQVMEHSINVEGGTAQSAYSLTLSNLNQDGVIPFSEFDRTSINIGGRTKLENGLKFGGTMSYSKSKQVGPKLGSIWSADAGESTSMARTMWLNRTWDTNLPYEDADGAPVFFKDFDHPLWSWKHNKFTSNVDRLNASVNASYDIFKWLNAKVQYGVNTYADRRQQIVDIHSHGYEGLGNIIDGNIWLQEQEGSFTLTATKQLNNDISLRAVGGYNVYQREYQRRQYQGSEMITPGIYEIENTITQQNTASSYNLRRLYALFADVQMGYKDYLFLTLTARNDWSSTLPLDNRSFFYPAVSTSFIFTDAFGIENDVLSFGKINASWGLVANDANPYFLRDVYSLNYYGDGFAGALQGIELPFNGHPGLTVANTKTDPNLKPEFTQEFELGAELRFLKNRIGINATYYNRLSYDQIARVSVPNSTGYSSMFTNFGELRNQGVELEFNATPVKLANGFRWNIAGTFTKNISQVEALRDGVDELVVDFTFGLYTNVLQVGQPYGVIKGTPYLRDDQGNLLIDPADGSIIASNEQAIIGDPNPDFRLGFINTFSFKGITLSAVLDYRHGGDIFSYTIERYYLRGVTKDTEENREQLHIINGYLGNPDTQEPYYDANGNKIPNTIVVGTNDIYFDNMGDEGSIFDGTTLYLREVSLSYSLPKKWLANLPIGSAVISATGRNLWFYSPNLPKYANYNPEVNTLGNANSQGLDYGNPPAVRRFGFNLKLTF